MISSDAEFDRAVGEVERLLCAKSSPAQSRRLVQLSVAVSAYDQKRDSAPDLSPAEQLKYLMEVHGLTAKQLSAATGVPRSSIEAVLFKDGQFEEDESALLAKHFALTPSAFYSEPELKVTVHFSAGVQVVRKMLSMFTYKTGASAKEKLSREVTLPVSGTIQFVCPSELQPSAAFS